MPRPLERESSDLRGAGPLAADKLETSVLDKYSHNVHRERESNASFVCRSGSRELVNGGGYSPMNTHPDAVCLQPCRHPLVTKGPKYPEEELSTVEPLQLKVKAVWLVPGSESHDIDLGGRHTLSFSVAPNSNCSCITFQI